jgi:hypothetical protein
VASSAKVLVPSIIERQGMQISRDDLDEIRLLLVREPDPVEAYEARQAAYEAIWLVVADPRYRGDISLADLGEGPTHEEAADQLLSALLAH